MTSHNDKVVYLSKCIAIEDNRVKGLRRSGKDTTAAEKDLLTARVIHSDYARKRVDLVKTAGILGNDRYFWVYYSLKALKPKDRESFHELPDISKKERAENFIRIHCNNIISRKELSWNEEAQDKFNALYDDFRS